MPHSETEPLDAFARFLREQERSPLFIEGAAVQMRVLLGLEENRREDRAFSFWTVGQWEKL